jgi:hypothetical protein
MTVQLFLIAEFALGLLAGIVLGATKVEKVLLHPWQFHSTTDIPSNRIAPAD